MDGINMVLHTKFKVMQVAKTETRIFKGLKVGEIVDILMPLNETTDREKGQRMQIYFAGRKDPIYISDLNRMINKGFKFEEVKK